MAATAAFKHWNEIRIPCVCAECWVLSAVHKSVRSKPIINMISLKKDENMTSNTSNTNEFGQELDGDSLIPTSVGTASLSDLVITQAMFKAESIRRNAGCQPWVTLGPADISEVGVTADTRTNAAVITITSEQTASALAASGTGTQADPYLIKDKNIVFASGSPGFVLNDPQATYYIRFYNILASGSSNGSSIINMVGFGTPVAFERCKFQGANGSADELLAYMTTGSLEMYGCEIAGVSNYCFFGNGTAAKSVKLTDCIVSGTAKSSVTNGVFYAYGPGEFKVEVTRCLFNSSHFHWHIGNGWTIEYTMVRDTQISGCAVGIGDLNYLKPGGNIYSQIPNMIQNSHFKNVRFTYTPYVTQTAVYGNGADKCVFENCSFDGNVAERRLFEWRRAINVTLLQCYFQKADGTDNAGNEVCEFWETSGLMVRECWTDGAPEDCYELVMSYGNNKFIDNVGDNVTGQLVDIFGVGSFDVEIDGVYGDCGDAAVLVTDVDYVRVRNVFVKQTGISALGCVVLERRNAAPDVSPKGCVIIGFLSPPEVSSQGLPFAVDTTQATLPGGIGQNFAAWWEEGELKFYGEPALQRMSLR